MKLTFCGGARSVTGSNYLLETENTKILIDCGLHQGDSYCEDHNFNPFPYDPKEISAVFITHAHIDHIGRLPQLVKAGFAGKIYSTPPTKDFGELLLLDSEHIMKEEARKRRKEPLYETQDITNTLALWHKIPYRTRGQVGDFAVEFYDAGHILGSSCILVSAEGKKIIFSGDLGNNPAPLINNTDYVEDVEVDYALVESVYGARVHEKLTERKDLLEDFIEEIVKSDGVLLIPAFALERTQEMIFELNELVENNRIPRAKVFIDSPLAIKLTAVYQKYSADPTYFNPASTKLVREGDSIFNFPGLNMTLTTEESKQINDIPPPKIILAGSGMSNAGRILYHEQRYLSDPKNAILFIGFQASGSLGRKILDGAKSVKILGEDVSVRCRVKAIGGYSAHADEPQLLKWLEAMRFHLKKVFVVQGEDDQSLPFAQKIKDELALPAVVPNQGDSVIL